MLVNLSKCSQLSSKKFLEFELFFYPPSEFLQILAFYCIFEHQFLAKILEFLYFRALFGKKFGEFGLELMKVAKSHLKNDENENFFKNQLEIDENQKNFKNQLEIDENQKFSKKFCL